jgi:hypothetical protein
MPWEPCLPLSWNAWGDRQTSDNDDMRFAVQPMP